MGRRMGQELVRAGALALALVVLGAGTLAWVFLAMTVLLALLTLGAFLG